MSQENVEGVRAVYEGWSRENFSVGADLFSPDFSWEPHSEAVELGSLQGADVGNAIRNSWPRAGLVEYWLR